MAASALFAQRIHAHLRRGDVNLQDVTWQTDNCGEFIGELKPDGSRSGFPPPAWQRHGKG
jgi:acyl-coenzyme A synthetase/AMP-(fatty) acid ligase